MVPGEYDTNGLASEAARRKMGNIFSTTFLSNEDCPFYDNPYAMCTQLGHASMASLKADYTHWIQFGQSLDAQVAVVLMWLGKKADIIHMFSATA